MDIDKGILVNLILAIHMILMGIALMRLFKLKNATGGLVIISIFIMMIPIVGPSGLITYYNRLYIKKQKETNKTSSRPRRHKNH